MKIAERIVIVVLLVGILGGGVWFALYVKNVIDTEHQQKLEDVKLGKYQLSTESTLGEVSPEDWRIIYPNTVPLQIGSTSVEASVADSLPERIKGLSNTPFLPDNVVKLFAFGTPGNHSIWMKDMNYPLDILWAEEDGTIVHIEENVSPDTYSRENPRASRSYESPVPAWFVIEANAGFVASNTIQVGDKMTLQ